MAKEQNGSGMTAPEAGNWEKEKLERRRSAVRVTVTYIAAGFLFVGGAVVVGYFLGTNQTSEGKDVFFSILPVAAAVISYWFAKRSDNSMTPDDIVKIMDATKRTSA